MELCRNCSKLLIKLNDDDRVTSLLQIRLSHQVNSRVMTNEPTYGVDGPRKGDGIPIAEAFEGPAGTVQGVNYFLNRVKNLKRLQNIEESEKCVAFLTMGGGG